jgi:lipopolysaccharide transport system ATP-binding protein
MTEVLIQAENISKKFCRSLKKSLWYGITDVCHSLSPWSESAREQQGEKGHLREQEFWALQDISFEVRRGQCLGLIGHNGAGKSTLLKILNGLIRPDAGQVTMRGRVGALIELNAGFNPVLTGRENIYSQAALLGFSRAEIAAKYEEIVEFSELRDFLEMPLQNYSSGMKVKLGFAVASQLEPDILLIDEVLAVGDLGFRFKCLNKISDLLKKCAVVFVSHSMTQVMRVSSHIMMLKGGREAFFGTEVAQGLEAYYQLFSGGTLSVTGNGAVKLRALEVWSGESRCQLEGALQIQHGDTVRLRVTLQADPHIREAVIQVLFWNHEMIPVLEISGRESYGFHFFPDGDQTVLEVEMSNLPLNTGSYFASVIVTAPGLEKVYCQADNSFRLTVGAGSPVSGVGCVCAGGWAVR